MYSPANEYDDKDRNQDNVYVERFINSSLVYCDTYVRSWNRVLRSSYRPDDNKTNTDINEFESLA